MTTYRVEGIFHASAGVPANILTGTIDISGGTVTAMDLVVPTFAGHFTEIYFNQLHFGDWLLSGQTPGSCECIGGAEDYLSFTFQGGPTLSGFTQAKITGGAVVHNTFGTDYADYFAHGGTTTYHGLSLTGTICPLSGCDPWPIPVKGVPGPVSGGGALGLVLLTTLILRRFR